MGEKNLTSLLHFRSIILPKKHIPSLNTIIGKLLTSLDFSSKFDLCLSQSHPTTSFLTATMTVYATGAGITAAAGTRLALQLILDKRFKLFSFQLVKLSLRPLLIIVTTSHFVNWVICAPAAFLGNGRRFSGALSEIPHPWFVTRHNHRSPLRYRPKLIGQKFDRFVAGLPHAIRLDIMTHHSIKEQLGI